MTSTDASIVRLDKDSHQLRSRHVILILTVLCSLLVASFAISSASLWVDELSTWFLAQPGSLSEWWTQLRNWPDTDLQDPLYHFYMLLWTHVFGTSAVLMRASNVVLFVIATVALVWPFRDQKTVAFPVLLAASFNSLLWYYLNDLRPYIMLYSGMSLMLGSAVEMLTLQRGPDGLTIKVFCIGAVLASGATVLGIAWCGSVVLFILLYGLLFGRISIARAVVANWATLTVTALVIATIAIYDFSLFGRGVRPELIYESSIFTMLFSVYSILGLLGLGPGMLELRENGAHAIIPWLPILIPAALSLSAVAAGGIWYIYRLLDRQTFILLVACTLLPILFTQFFGFVLHWRVLPRHYIPLVSIFVLVCGYGLARWWRGGLGARALVALSVLVMIGSSLSVRLAPRHARDAYEQAATLAKAELDRDGQVWWAAEVKGLMYYGVPYAANELEWRQAEDRKRVHVVGWTSFDSLAAQKAPALILVSRPESYDRAGAVKRYLETHKYHLVERFPAFTAWRQ